MNCANCGAPTRFDRSTGLLVCDYCGGEFAPPLSEDGVKIIGSTKFKCPACDGMLSEGQIESHDLLYCTGCRGMLIGMDDFMPLIETLRSYHQGAAAVPVAAASASSIPRLCPRCSKPMENHPYLGAGNVAIDTCEDCSVNWLDKGELQRIVAAPDRTYGASLLFEEDAADDRSKIPPESAS